MRSDFILTPPTGTLRIRIDATLSIPLVATSSSRNTLSSSKISHMFIYKSIQGTSTGYPLILLCRHLFPPNLHEFQVEVPDQVRGPSIIPCTLRRRCLERKRARHRNRSRGGLYVFKGDSRLLSKTRPAGTLLLFSSSDVTLPNPLVTTTCVQNPRRSSGLVGNLHTC